MREITVATVQMKPTLGDSENNLVKMSDFVSKIASQHKVHLRGEERMAFREGFKLPVIDTGEIGKIGLMLGWDLAFPEVARAMTLDGAELLCVMANWETSYTDEWKTYVRARAYENAVFVAAANRVGEDVTMKFGGESMIVGPRGRVYASLETEVPA